MTCDYKDSIEDYILSSVLFLGQDLKLLGLGEKFLGSKGNILGLGGKFSDIFEISKLSLETNDFSTKCCKYCVVVSKISRLWRYLLEKKTLKH